MLGKRLDGLKLVFAPGAAASLARGHGGSLGQVTVKEQLHRAVDAMTEAEAQAALRTLAEASRDPVAWVIAHAPVDDEPEIDEERGAVEETKRELAAGERTVVLEEVKRELGLA